MMKRTILILIAVMLSLRLSAQLFNTGQTLNPNKFSFGIEPALLINENTHLIFLLHGGYGITNGMDLGVTIGGQKGLTYLGVDIEVALGRYITGVVGIHDFGLFGLDGTILTTIPIRKDIRVFGGADLDINFNRGTPMFLLWLPVGAEFGIYKRMSLISEFSLAITKSAYNFIGAGVMYYF
jgi:hypothetical protein